MLSNRLEKAIEEAKKKKNESHNTSELELSDWRKLRPYLDLSYVSDYKENCDSDEDEHAKEESLVNLLLTCLMGGQSSDLVIHGESILSDDLQNSFTFNNRGADPIESEFAVKCLTLAQYYSVLASFIEDNYFISKGRVNGSLAAGLECVIHDYQSFIVTLEKFNKTKEFTLQDLWYQIQDINETFRTLANLVKKLNESDARGAKTLSVIHQFILHLTVPNLERKICVELITEAAAPYMEMVQKWVFNGEIDDPFDEFMVSEHFTSTSKEKWNKMEEYWGKKYQIRKAHVPVFLEKLEKKILNSGKYLNVIKECVSSERDFKLAPLEEINYSESESYVSVIDRAYSHSSKLLLNYMLNEHKIKDRIISLKKYFLVEQGDFVVQLLDTCDDELMKETSEILPSRLTTLVEMAIRIPSTNDDPYRDEIIMSLQKYTLSEQINRILGKCKDLNRTDSDSSSRYNVTGYESFALAINCEWPISLVLHYKIISSYQMLFRHLFYCKYIERILCKVWVLSQQLRSVPFAEARIYTKTNALAYKMMIFLQNVEYYMMEVAIESHWMEFMQNFDGIPNVDDLISEHWKFLDLSMKDCLLLDSELFNIFRDMLTDFLEFGNFTSSIKTLSEVNKFPSFPQRIDQLDDQFEENLNRFYFALQDASINDTSSKLVSLFYRLKHLFNKED